MQSPMPATASLLTTLTQDIAFERSRVWQVSLVQGQMDMKEAIVTNLSAKTTPEKTRKGRPGSGLPTTCRTMQPAKVTALKRQREWSLPQRSIRATMSRVEITSIAKENSKTEYLRLRVTPCSSRGNTKLRLQQQQQADVQIRPIITDFHLQRAENNYPQPSSCCCRWDQCHAQTCTCLCYSPPSVSPSISSLMVQNPSSNLAETRRYRGDSKPYICRRNRAMMPGRLESRRTALQLESQIEAESSRMAQARRQEIQDPREKNMRERPKVQVRSWVGLIYVRRVPLRGSTMPIPIPQRKRMVRKYSQLAERQLRSPRAAWRRAANWRTRLRPQWSARYWRKEPRVMPRKMKVTMASRNDSRRQALRRTGRMMAMTMDSSPSLSSSRQTTRHITRCSGLNPTRPSSSWSNDRPGPSSSPFSIILFTCSSSTSWSAGPRSASSSPRSAPPSAAAPPAAPPPASQAASRACPAAAPPPDCPAPPRGPLR